LITTERSCIFAVSTTTRFIGVGCIGSREITTERERKMYKSDFEKGCDAFELELSGRETSLLSRFWSLPFSALLSIPVLAYESWVLLLVWNWLVASTVGLVLTFWAAFGINLVISFLMVQPRRRSLYETLWAFGMQIRITTMALLVGAVIHLLSM